MGGLVGSHPPSPWEPRFAAEGPAARGDWDAAAALVRGVLDEHPDDARAHELLPDTVAWAADEDDLATIRDRAAPPPG